MTPDAALPDAHQDTPAMLKIDPLSGDLGSVTVGASPSTTAFTISNTGEATSGAIQASVSGANASDFTATSACATLDGGDTCTVTVNFHPSTAGAKTGTLTVSGSPGGSVTASLAGNGGVPGTLQLTTPASQALGTVTVGQTSTTEATFTVKNTGTQPTTALLASLTGADVGEFTISSDACNGMVLQPNATCNEVLKFAPLSSGAKSASITISATTGGTISGAVSGTGVNPAHLVVNPTLLPFGSQQVLTTSGAQTVTVTNNGGVASSPITLPITGTNPGAFSVVPGGTCNGALAAGASCSFNVKFAPTVAGDNSATLTVTAATGGDVAVALSGTGTTPGQITISDVPFAYNNTNVGSQSASHTFTITNGGGTTTSPITVALGGASPEQFTVVAGSNGCNSLALASMQSCTIAIQFAPTSGGAKQAAINVTSSAGTVTGAISGTAVAPVALAITPPSRDFGSVVVNTTSSPLTFTVTNTGGVTSAVPSLVVSGANASEFTAMGCTVALTATGTAGDNCTISVTYHPTSTGSKSAAVTVTAGTASVTGQLSGSAISQAQIVPNPTTINFPGYTVISESAAPISFTVTNNGAQTTAAISVATTGPFTQTNNCTTLVTGAACTVIVTYTPTVAGNSTGGITVTTAGDVGGHFTVSASGVAKNILDITAPASATDGTFAFDDVQVNPDTTQQVVFTVINNDDVAHNLTNDFVAGANTTIDETTPFGNSDIDLISDTCDAGGNIAAGATCTITIRFDPQTVGAKIATLTEQINGTTDAAHRVTLVVSGTATVASLGVAINTACATLPCSPNPTTLGTTPSASTVAYNYGSLPVGTSGATRRFYFGNTSGTITGVLNTTLTGAGFAITSNTCAGAQLANNDQCFVDVTFFPSSAASSSATLTVSATNTLGGSATATLTGAGTAGFSTISPTSVAFGTVFAGDTTVATIQKTVTITNNSGQVEGLTINVTGGAEFSRQGGSCGTTLSPVAGSNSCTVIVQFAPTAASLNAVSLAKTGTLEIDETPASGFGGTETDVALTGTARSTLVISPTTATFTNVPVGTSATQSFVVTNQSTQAISGITVTGNATFVVLNNTCGTLTSSATPATATCGFDLVYTPSTATTTPITANITVQGTNGRAAAAVTATAITAAKLVNDRGPGTPDLYLGSVIVGQSSPTATITYSNTGTQATGAPTVNVTGATSDFTIANTCTAGLTTGTCTLTAKFNPTMTGPRAVTVTVSAAPGAVTPNTVVTQITGTGLASGDVAVAPSYVRFANTAQNLTTGPTQVFIFSNTSTTVGGKTLVARSVSAGFTIDTTTAGATTCVGGTTLNVGATCQVTVRFTPTTANEQRGTLSLTFGGQTVDASLEGFSLSPALVQATPASGTGIVFDDQIVNTQSADFSIVLKNVGGVSAGVSGTAVLGGNNTPDFILGTGCNGVTLAAGQSCTITVAFKPALALLRTATLTIPAFTGFAGATYNLSGTGVQPALLSLDITTPQNYTPGTPPSPTVNVGDTTGPTKTFTIANNSGTAESGPIAISLTNTTDFVFAGGTCLLDGTEQLDKSQSCTVVVRFRPRNLGVLSSTLSFSSPQGGTGSVALSGTAAQAGFFNVDTQDFGSGGAGDTVNVNAQKTLTFTNNSDSALGLVTTSITGTDFDIVTDNCAGRPLAAGAPCTIVVRFVPSGTVVADRTGTLTASGLVANTSFTTSDSVALTAHVNATP